jgi:fucose permease
MCLWSIPYGLGAGGVDAALNNYVALHYSARHMSWLHCFWGVGASISPYIMGAALSWDLGWRSGYTTVSVLQFVLTAVLVITLPVWKKVRFPSDGSTGDEETAPPVGLIRALKIRGVPYMLLAFFAYCSLEVTAILWTSSYLVENRGMDAGFAATFASLFYRGITFGRFLNGFVADRIGDRNLIRIGIGVIFGGIGFVMLPIASDIPTLAGMLIIGLGCAPIYPSIIHATPSNFGRENSQAIIGMQMTSAYIGSTFMPPVFGFVAELTTVGIFPIWLLVLLVVALLVSERLNKVVVRD